MPRHHLDWMMPSNWQEPMVRLPGSLIVCNTPYSNILPGLYIVQSTACWIWGSGTARFKYQSLQLYEALLGRKYLCVHAGSRVFSTEQRFGDKSDLLQLPPPPPPPTLHTSNGQRTKHRHQGTSAKAGFGMMVSRKCSGPEGIHRKTPQKDRPGSLTFSHGCVFLELQGIAKTPQRSLASHGGQKGRKPASNKLIILKTAIKTPINKKTC